eukprot:g2182.t1
MGPCLATIFKGGHGGRGKYGPLRTSTTARYGTNSRNQSYLGAGHSGRRVDGSAKKSKDWMRGVLRASNGVESSASSGGTITCPECGHTTFSKRDMHRHIATRHGGKVKRPRKPNPKTGANSSDHGDSIGGKAGERARNIQWSDLHKSESELAAEQFAREHPEFDPHKVSKPSAGQAKKDRLVSQFKAASERAGSFVKSARMTFASSRVTRGTRGVSQSTRVKKKKKRKKRKGNK